VNVGHAGEADVLLELPGDELRAVVRDDARRDAGVKLSGALHEELHVDLLHRLADLLVDDVAAASIKDGAEVVEGACDVEVGASSKPGIIPVVVVV